MTIEELDAFVALILAISLAGERLFAIIKTVFPGLEGEESDRNPLWRVNVRIGISEGVRGAIVAVVVFLACWVSAAFLAENGFNMFGRIVIEGQDVYLPVFVVAFLASGGSSFWENLLGWTKSVRKLRWNQARGEGSGTGRPALS